MILKGYILGISYALVCLIVSLILYKLGMAKKYTRKVVHILVGFEWVILYHFMGAGIHFLCVCLIFLALLTVAYFGRLMPMISSEGDNAPGTVYYAVAMTGVAAVGCFVPEVMLPFGIGVMCTSLGDGFAGAVGQLISKNNPKVYGNKTLYGTLTNFLVSSASAYVISALYGIPINVWHCLAIGLISTELELVTPHGLDNISITWGATALAYAFAYLPGINDYLLPIILSPIIVIFATSKNALTNDGIAAALILDLAVSVAFGNFGFLILCVFFVGSVIIDKIKKRQKNKGREDIDAKGSCRDYMQVLANGAIAFISALAFAFTKNRVFVVAFVASMAEAFADTAASGIGAFATNVYDPFRRKKCEKGLSGGMSVEGTLASLFAACLVAIIAYTIGYVGFGLSEFLIVTVAAFVGGVIDSLLGSLLQVKYKCTVCGKLTERTEHCDTPAEHYSGLKFIDNDIVNILSCALSAIIAVAAYVLF